MESLFRKLVSYFNRSNKTYHFENAKDETNIPIKNIDEAMPYISHSKVVKNETNTHVHTVTVDLNSFTPKPKVPIPRKEIYYNDDNWRIGITVEYRRKHLKLTQKQLSDLLGYKSTSFVSNLELGTREKLTHEQLENLAKCLNTTTDKLLNDEVYD